MIISVENNLTSILGIPYTFTSTNLAVGAGTISVKNTNALTAQYAQQIGKTGEELSEIVMPTSISGTAMVISGTTRFSHSVDTPIYQINYDKIIFKRSTTGTAGTASAIATVSITPDSFYTEYDDTSGAASYAYKTQYYNSVSGALSSESDWFTPAGPSFYQLQRLRSRIKAKLYNAGFIKNDSDIDDWINEWKETMTNAAIKVDKAYSLGTANYSFGTAGLGTVTASLFKHANKIEITYDGVNYYPSTEIPAREYSSNDIFSGLAPRHAWVGDTVFQTLPSGNAGTARFTLSQFSDPLVDDTDELPQFLRPYTTGCTEYALYVAYGLDEKDQVAEKHYAKHMGHKDDFVKQITPRDQTTFKTIMFTDELTGFLDTTEYI